MRTRETPIVFDCAGDQLVGILHEPERAHDIGMVIVVGGPQYRVGSHRQFTLMARALAQAGFAVVRFDYRGMGDSAGDVRAFECLDADIRAATDVLLQAIPQLSGVVLWGLCDGASAILMCCNNDPRIRGLVLANPWVRTESGEARAYLRHYYLQRLLQGAFWRKLLSGEFSLRSSIRDLFGKMKAARVSAPAAEPKLDFIERMYLGMQRFAGSTLLLISDQDLTAREFMDLCRREQRWQRQLRKRSVQVVELKDADHTFSGTPALHSAIEHTRAWLTAFDA